MTFIMSTYTQIFLSLDVKGNKYFGAIIIVVKLNLTYPATSKESFEVIQNNLYKK